MSNSAFPTIPIATTVARFYALNFMLWVGLPRGRHMGIDLTAYGHVPVAAVADGKIFQAGYFQPGTSIPYPGGYGRHVIIQHDGYKTLYAHLWGDGEMMDVVLNVGDDVLAGHLIGHMGGDLVDPYRGTSGGHHLHMECILPEKPDGLDSVQTPRGWSVDPVPWLSERLCAPPIARGVVKAWNGLRVRVLPSVAAEGFIIDSKAPQSSVEIMELVDIPNGEYVDQWARLRSIRPEWCAVRHQGKTYVEIS